MLRLAVSVVLVVAVAFAVLSLLPEDDKHLIDDDSSATQNPNSTNSPPNAGSATGREGGGSSVRTSPFAGGGAESKLGQAALTWIIKGQVRFVGSAPPSDAECGVTLTLHPDAAAQSAPLSSLAATTTPRGEFQFQLPSDFDAATLAIGLIASSKSWVGERVIYPLGEYRSAAHANGTAKAQIEAQLRLVAATHLTVVRVLSRESSRPIPRAQVSLAGVDDSQGTLTDEDGRASIGVPDPARDAQEPTPIVVSAKGYASIRLEGTKSLGERTVLLPKSRTLEGGVWDWEGKPVSDALISIVHPATLRSSARTNNEGQFELPCAGVNQQTMTIMVWHKDHATTRHAVDAANVDWKWNVRLPETHRITVQVAKPDGTPAPGALIELGLDSPAAMDKGGVSSRGQFWTDATGRAECKAVGKRAATAKVRAKGFSTQHFELSFESDTPQYLKLKAANSRRGVVMSSEGRPIEGAVLRLAHLSIPRFEPDAPPAEVSHTTSDANGEFEVSFLPEHTNHPLYLYASAEGFIGPSWSLPVAVDSQALIRVVMRKVVALEGVVTNREGLPISDFWIDYVGKEREALPPARSPGTTIEGHHFTQRFDGSFRIESIPLVGELPTDRWPPESIPDTAARSISLAIRAEGFATRHVWDLALSETMQPLSIRLERAGEVTGRVIDAKNGSPLARVIIGLRSAWEDGASEPRVGPVTWTKNDGSFTLKNVPLEAQQLRFGYPSTAPLDVIMPAPDAQGRRAMQDIRMSLTGSLSLCAQNPTEAPLTDTAIELTSVANRQMSRYFVNAKGKAEAEHLEPGQYELLVKSSVSSLDGLLAVIEVAAGSHQTVIFKPTTQRSTVQGSVALAGQPAIGVQIDVFRGSETSVLMQVQSNQQGEFSLRDLEPGTYRLVASFVDQGETFSGSIEVNLTANHPPIALVLRKQ